MRLVVGLRPVSDTTRWTGHAAEPADGLELRCAGAWAGQAGLRWVAGGPEASQPRGCEAMGGLLAAGQPDYAAGCAWNLGWAGWAELCLGVAGSASYTLGPEAGWQVAGWAGPEACRRHVRHASRRAEGLYFETSLTLRRRGWVCWMTWGQTRAGGQGLTSLG